MSTGKKGKKARAARSEYLERAQRAPSPRPVTRGERSERKASGGVLIDWLHVTFDGESMELETLIEWLRLATGLPISAVPGRGLHGFAESFGLFAHYEADAGLLGFVARGGASQRGRWLLQLTGTGCGLVRDWAAIYSLCDTVLQDVSITRIDLAKDLLEGERSITDAVEAYRAGGMNCGGRQPRSQLAGDWLGIAQGRTLYVGNAKNGKLLRVYEKGRQLGDAASEWVRFEVQLGNKSREIPLDVLLRPAVYFAGAYPYLAELVEEHPEAIKTQSREGEISLARLVHYMRQSYGRVLHVVRGLGVDPSELVQEVTLLGVPRRLSLAEISAGISWPAVVDRLHILKEGVV